MQTSRLFEIIYLLSERPNVTAKMLSEHFEVSTRTIYRDIETLCAAGITIYTDRGKGGGIRLMEGFVFDKSVMTPDEKKLLVSGLQAVTSIQPEENKDMLSKLESMLGSDDGNWIEVDFGNWRNASHEEELFQLMKNAIFHKKVITFDYTGLRGEPEHREVEPVRLVFKGMAWYLYGYCRKREDYRFFKLMRMQHCCLTGELHQRTIQGNVIPKKNYHKGKEVTLKLLVKATAAYRAYDEFCEYEVLENGDVVTEWTTQEGSFIYEYLLSYGENLEVLAPPEIRQGLANIAGTICEKYKRF